MRKTIEIVIGIVLVLLGIVGGLIPVLQGWIFGIPGLVLLSRHVPWVRRFLEQGLDRLEPRLPRFSRSLKAKLREYYSTHPKGRR